MKEISFENIKKANESIKTTDIKGKEYAEVNQRIKAFRMVYPNGYILTDIVSIENGVCVMKSTAGYYDENGNSIVLGSGTAYEKESSSFINKTSYIENCETSAVGRALGMCGFGIDTSVASFEEVQNAIENQKADDVFGGCTKTQQKEICKLLTEKYGNGNEKEAFEILCKSLKIKAVKTADLTVIDADKVIGELKKC